jgi:hypothetical protein
MNWIGELDWALAHSKQININQMGFSQIHNK